MKHEAIESCDGGGKFHAFLTPALNGGNFKFLRAEENNVATGGRSLFLARAELCCVVE
jgi:hypothetical protein